MFKTSVIEKKKDRLPMGKFFAWKTRDISLGCSFIIMGYLTIYCTDTLGMPAALVGTLLLASKIFDGITDLFAGFIVDNTHTKIGKARPYELAVIGLWLSTLLLFSCPDLGMVGKSIWVFFGYTFVNSVFATLLNANQTPYMIRAFGSRQMIIKVASYGGIVSTVGAAIVSISFPMLMAKIATSPAGWRELVLMYAIPLLLIGLLRFIFVKETYDVDGGKTEKVSIKELIEVLKINKYAWMVAGIYMLAQMVTGMNAAIYYFTWIVKDVSKYGTLQAFTLIMLFSMFLFPRIMRKFPVSKMIMGGAILGAAGFIVNFFAGSSMAMLIVAFFATSFAMLPTSYLMSILVMDCASFNEWKGYGRVEGTLSSLNNFGGKIGSGVGSALLGILLGVAGYNGTLMTQPDSAIMMIRSLYSLVPMVIYILMAIIAYRFKLDKMMPQIDKENAERKAQMN